MIRKNPLSWSVRQICIMIDKSTITFDNPNQRPSGQWDHNSATLLINSIFNMFIPDIITLQKQGQVNGKTANIYDVIDGKQRLTLLHSFRKDQWALGTMEPITLPSTNETYDISGLKYSELPKDVQDEIDSFTLVIRPIEVEEDEDEEEVVNMVMYRLNNGKAMTREHLALLAAPLKIREYVHNKTKNHVLFTEKAHFPDGSIKKSGREMAVMQSLVLAGKLPYESFVTRHIEATLTSNEVPEDAFDNVDQAFEMISNVFEERHKFISKVNIPSFVYLLVNNDFDNNVINFIRWYSSNNKKGDLYRRYAGGTKKSDVEGRLNGLQRLFDEFRNGMVTSKEGQAELIVEK